ncbi:ATPase [Vibrio parahaemolyticus]|nr:ATPase [Vibrio parahaemolyticus]EHK0063370.1 ATPase [Vibrio parahaemolyticus]
MTKPKRVVISWSSGKDSTLTLERLNENPDYQVVGLYTTYVGKEVPFQATPLEVVQMQADLLGLPLITIELPDIFPSNDIYQSTIVNALTESDLEIEAVAFGDMFCNGIADYRRSYIDPCGENGEFHTLVTSTPSFQGHIELIKLEVEIGERFSHQRYRAKALPKQI